VNEAFSDIKTYLVITALLLSNTLAACEYMGGKWSSNKELRMEYNYSLSSLDKRAISILAFCTFV
jgi:hypothetical protein